ncbi:MAG: DUF2769 domain-containing protein [Coriobacteriia bacterium]|nr:DUF2769 domain-containing protein [Coriobacteriia bacterium]
MEQTTMKRVEFNMSNIEKCQCGVCPVQTNSSCIAEKSERMRSMMGPGAHGTPSPQDVPGLYCATGIATCGDLDYEQPCLCPRQCQVYQENELSAYKYCQQGSAADVG